MELQSLFPSEVGPKVVQIIHSLVKQIQISSASMGAKCKGRNTVRDRNMDLGVEEATQRVGR